MGIAQPFVADHEPLMDEAHIDREALLAVCEQQRRTRSLARSFAVSLAGFPSLELHNEERSGSQPSQSYIENSTKRRPK